MDQSTIDHLLNQVEGSIEPPATGTSMDGAVAEISASLGNPPSTSMPNDDGSAAIHAAVAAAGNPTEDFDTAPPGDFDSGLAGEFAPPPLTASKKESLSHGAPEFQRLMSVEVPVIVLLGQRRMNVGEVMRLAVGTIIEFTKSADEELELHVNNKRIGQGTAVKVGENFGIKITSIGSVRETIRKLGAN